MNGRFKDKNLYANFYIKAFLMGLALSVIMFIPILLEYGSLSIAIGEINSKILPYYQIAHNAVKSDSFGWNNTTDLGVNFIGSYSQYLLGSPFFWITLPFSASLLEYFMIPIILLKLAFACLTSFIFLKRYVKNKNFAVLGAILYTFSGFSIYNIFYANMHDAVIFFPLLLASIDMFFQNKKKGRVALCVFICCISSYSLFFGQLIFCLIYLTVKFIYKKEKINARQILFLVIEFLIGIGLACALVVPSIIYISDMYSLNNVFLGSNSVFYSETQVYIQILIGMFLPANLSTVSINSTSIMSTWLPAFGMVGVAAWLNLKHKNWLKTLIVVLIICVIVPSFSLLFQGFSTPTNTNWFYMLTLTFSLATIMSLENKRANWKKSIKFTFVLSAIIVFIVNFVPNFSQSGKLSFGLVQFDYSFLAYCAITLVSFALLVFLFKYVSKENFVNFAVLYVSVVSVLCGMYFINVSASESQETYSSSELESAELTINITDSERSEFYQFTQNSSLLWDVSLLQPNDFTGANSTLDFYNYVDLDNTETFESSEYALRAITSVRWLFDAENDDDYFATENYDTPAMPGWIYYGSDSGYDIWQNEYYIPMGFTYDSYITASEVANLSAQKILLIMVKTAIIPDEDEAIWSSILDKFDISTVVYTKDQYMQDCLDRASTSASEFNYTNTGFTAVITSTTENAVFFSVPYDKGWSATVNGVEATVLETNEGFMSVIVPASENIQIEFVYNTPGLSLGVTISALSLLAFILYMSLLKFKVLKISKSRETFASYRKVQNFKIYCKNKKINFAKRNENGFLRVKKRNDE
ncbi:MAG: YfhO family protein [Clostridia bacterium]